jgi:hypothetical protein
MTLKQVVEYLERSFLNWILTDLLYPETHEERLEAHLQT